MSGGYGWFNPQGAAPVRFQQLCMAAPALNVGQAAFNYQAQYFMQPGHMYGQAVCAYNQGQYLTYLCPAYLPASSVVQNLKPAVITNGQVVYEFPHSNFYSVPGVAPPPNPPKSHLSHPDTKIKYETQGDDQTYVKKPLNAFFLFKKEQEQNVMDGFDVANSAAVNVILGLKWRALSKADRVKYHQAAKRERERHCQEFPDWSFSDNYGKKRKRKRVKRKAPPAAANVPNKDTQQLKKLRVTPATPKVIENPPSERAALENLSVNPVQTSATIETLPPEPTASTSLTTSSITANNENDLLDQFETYIDNLCSRPLLRSSPLLSPPSAFRTLSDVFNV